MPRSIAAWTIARILVLTSSGRRSQDSTTTASLVSFESAPVPALSRMGARSVTSYAIWLLRSRNPGFEDRAGHQPRTRSPKLQDMTVSVRTSYSQGAGVHRFLYSQLEGAPEGRATGQFVGEWALGQPCVSCCLRIEALNVAAQSGDDTVPEALPGPGRLCRPKCE